MNAQTAKKNQTASKKDHIDALNSDAAEINRYLQSKSRFLDAAEKLGSNLTGKEHQRLYGAGIKNYGFIEMLTMWQWRKRGRDKPTEKELIRDAGKLLHGKADGEIVIKNESPHVTIGKRKIIDSVRKGKTKIKETAEAGVSK
jgi:hypothetical protein